jgi:hypothetical protein
MQTIYLPLSRWETLGAPLLMGALVLLAALSPVETPWRVGLATFIALFGIQQYRVYRARRPSAVVLAGDGTMVLRFPEGTCATVVRLLPGAVGPALLTARCTLASGRHIDLFVPGSRLDERDHWRLRRSVRGFAPDQSRRGR